MQKMRNLKKVANLISKSSPRFRYPAHSLSQILKEIFSFPSCVRLESPTATASNNSCLWTSHLTYQSIFSLCLSSNRFLFLTNCSNAAARRWREAKKKSKTFFGLYNQTKLLFVLKKNAHKRFDKKPNY